MAQLSTYPFPSPVYLPDGRVIDSPGTTVASYADCLPFQCGEDPTNDAGRMWCAFWGKSGARSCDTIPRTGPMLVPNQNTLPEPTKMPMPQATSAVMPSMTTTANATQDSQQSQLQPTDLLHPMPSIVNPAPAVMNEADAGLCSGFSGWVSENPLLSAALLGGFALLLFNRKGR